MRHLGFMLLLACGGFLPGQLFAQTLQYVPPGFDYGYTGIDLGGGVGFGYGAAFPISPNLMATQTPNVLPMIGCAPEGSEYWTAGPSAVQTPTFQGVPAEFNVPNQKKPSKGSTAKKTKSTLQKPKTVKK